MSYSWQQYPQQGGYPSTGQTTQTNTPQQVSDSSESGQLSSTQRSQFQAGYSHPGVAPNNSQAQSPYTQVPYPQQGAYQQAAYAQYSIWGASSGTVPATGSQPYGLYNPHNYGQHPQQAWGLHQGVYPYSGQTYHGYPQQMSYGPNYMPQLKQSKVAQPSPNNCYNCGDPSHWAQDCPEPRRAVPYGQLHHPNKRRRPNCAPPVITKYSVPPHVNPGSTGPHMPSQPMAPGPQLSLGPYNSNHGSASPPNISQHSNWQSSPPQQPSTGPSPSTPHSNHHFPETPVQQPRGSISSTGGHPPPPASQVSSIASRKASLDQSVSMESISETDDDEDYKLLDIPDFPRNHGSIIAKPPMLVRHPLPSLSESDDVGQMLPPTLMSDGKIQSKYILKDVNEYLQQGFRQLENFEQRRGDPLFTAIKSDFSTPKTQSKQEDQFSARGRPRSSSEECHSLIPQDKVEHAQSGVDKTKIDKNKGLARSPNSQGTPPPKSPSLSTANHNNRVTTNPPPRPPKRQASWSYSSNIYTPAEEQRQGSKRRFSSYAPNCCASLFEGSSHPAKKRKHEKNEDGQHSTEDSTKNDDNAPKLKRKRPDVAFIHGQGYPDGSDNLPMGNL